jgi:hypothetical protein
MLSSVVALTVAALSIWFVYQAVSSNLVKVTARTDGRPYWVQDLPDKQDAADLLGKLVNNVQKVIVSTGDEESAIDDGEAYTRLRKLFDPANIQENVQTSQHTSYSENKGQKIVLCLRKKDSSFELLEDNILMFVFLHELAHLMTKDTDGHSPIFWSNFKHILQRASSAGVYSPVDYSRFPVQYCGLDVTDNILFTDATKARA